MFDAEVIQNLVTAATDFTADFLRQLPLTETSTEMVDAYQCGYHYGLENPDTVFSEGVQEAIELCQG